MKITFVCDFDGTVAEKDVGSTLFRRYGSVGWESVLRDWKSGNISSRECLERECRISGIRRSELEGFARGQKLDPGFPAFAEWVRRRDFGILIVSDGLDYYIEAVLRRYGLGWVPFRSNRTVFNRGLVRPVFPFYERGCGRCGNCKRYHVERVRSEATELVFIGDGLSDRCAVRHADLVFAKGDLSEYCRREGMEFVGFEDFLGIIDYFERRDRDEPPGGRFPDRILKDRR